MSRILIFGGSGFIGTHLIQKLSDEGQADIVSIDIKAPFEQLDGVRYIQADVRDLSDFEIDGEIDKIYNFAAIHTTPGHETHEYYETNIKGATEITAFARRNHVKQIIFTSSISVYGPSEEMKTEQSQPAPQSAYGWSKWLAEGIHRSWVNEDEDRHLVIVRPAVIFGHREGGNFVRLAKLLKKGVFPYAGRKDTIKACFYVEDLLSAVFYAQSLQEKLIIFNGCYPDRYQLCDIVETFKSEYFPNVRTIMVPQFVLMTAARLLQPLSLFGLGIHPDRITKLVRSTDIFPGWLEAQGQAKKDQLPSALKRWEKSSKGKFD